MDMFNVIYYVCIDRQYSGGNYKVKPSSIYMCGMV